MNHYICYYIYSPINKLGEIINTMVKNKIGDSEVWFKAKKLLLESKLPSVYTENPVSVVSMWGKNIENWKH